MFSKPVSREVEAKDVKYALERAFTANVPTATPASTWATSRACPKKPGDYQEIPGIETPDKYTLVLHLTQGHRRGGRGRPRDADLGPGPEGVRAEVRREVPVDLRRGGRGLHRPLHGQVRRRRQGDRLRGRQDHRPGPQPGLRPGGRLPPGVPGRDRVPGRQRGHRRRGAPHPERPEPGRRRHRAALAAAQGAPGDQQAGALGGAGRWLAHDLDGQQPPAVQRHQRPQGDDRGLQPRRRPPAARWRGARARSPRATSRRAWPGSRSRVASRASPTPRTGWRSRRATATCRPSTSRRPACPRASTRATRRS